MVELDDETLFALLDGQITVDDVLPECASIEENMENLFHVLNLIKDVITVQSLKGINDVF